MPFWGSGGIKSLFGGSGRTRDEGAGDKIAAVAAETVEKVGNPGRDS